MMMRRKNMKKNSVQATTSSAPEPIAQQPPEGKYVLTNGTYIINRHSFSLDALIHVQSLEDLPANARVNPQFQLGEIKADGPPECPDSCFRLHGSRQLLCAQNTTSTTLELSPECVLSLPSCVVKEGIGANATYDTFTIPANGLYWVCWRVSLTKPINATITLSRQDGSIPAASTEGLSDSFECSSILTLQAGDALRLTIRGDTHDISLRPGVGAYLNLIRLD